jgi:hypothetical protein
MNPPQQLVDTVVGHRSAPQWWSSHRTTSSSRPSGSNGPTRGTSTAKGSSCFSSAGCKTINKYMLHIWCTTGTVASFLDHPNQGRTQLYRRNVDWSMLVQIMQKPRVHTGQGYHHRSLRASGLWLVPAVAMFHDGHRTWSLAAVPTALAKRMRTVCHLWTQAAAGVDVCGEQMHGELGGHRMKHSGPRHIEGVRKQAHAVSREEGQPKGGHPGVCATCC